jgi:hypothetical protein
MIKIMSENGLIRDLSVYFLIKTLTVFKSPAAALLCTAKILCISFGKLDQVSDRQEREKLDPDRL